MTARGSCPSASYFLKRGDKYMEGEDPMKTDADPLGYVRIKHNFVRL